MRSIKFHHESEKYEIEEKGRAEDNQGMAVNASSFSSDFSSYVISNLSGMAKYSMFSHFCMEIQWVFSHAFSYTEIISRLNWWKSEGDSKYRNWTCEDTILFIWMNIKISKCTPHNTNEYQADGELFKTLGEKNSGLHISRIQISTKHPFFPFFWQSQFW